MLTIGIYDAKAKLSELLAAVESGETITITRSRKPVAILRAVKPVYSDAFKREARRQSRLVSKAEAEKTDDFWEFGYDQTGWV
ncbi:MAG: type II toxin-antitoxin system prevent-host-death family antitoxin [Nitrosomonadales bacterium]|nr:type II toxin-antitoxin system prevent-host-death family antitoxin [Nitrosomonadales bacterium]